MPHRKLCCPSMPYGLAILGARRQQHGCLGYLTWFSGYRLIRRPEVHDRPPSARRHQTGAAVQIRTVRVFPCCCPLRLLAAT
jgi:hypothetical protein